MGLTAGTPMTDIAVDKVFIGSCTNARIEDLRAVAAIAKGHSVANTVHAMIVPGSGLVKNKPSKKALRKSLLMQDLIGANRDALCVWA